ncbi:DUF397 domain-containing protein [Streptomyces sp. IMTB 2501]|uniref:DUF397 domain-containing protein n=1 Tax=Streptomyces sp. IMTB 2501 TaxID=1776340 RepID=UPI00096BEBA3|nr:DUF397 domain-containing protein [Streptomyces sp. IMTB 2501]OLZ71364.1 DUF397 domain-containing protein [Streptomyces sp. IMTB 2501]
MQTLHWQKSTYSGDSSNCVEIATTPTAIHIRDSKNTGDLQLTIPSYTWTEFIRYAAGGRAS